MTSVEAEKLKKLSLFKRLIDGDLVNYLNYGALGIFGLAMILLVFGQSLGLWGVVGLDWMFQTKGVYADCTKPENRGNTFCQPKTNPVDREWKDMGRDGKRAMPFTLHGQ